MNNPTYKSHPSLYGRWYAAKATSAGMCKEWSNSFRRFAMWAMSQGYSEQLPCLIKRFNTKRPYSPTNCKIIIINKKVRRTHRTNRCDSLRAIWCGMKERCYNPKHPAYDRYRLIGVCDEWKDSFTIFRAWAQESGFSKGLTLDRINNSKGYGPDNCRWVTYAEQARNRKSNKWVELDGERMCFKDASIKLGIKETNLTFWFSPKYPNRKVPAKYADRIRLIL